MIEVKERAAGQAGAVTVIDRLRHESAATGPVLEVAGRIDRRQAAGAGEAGRHVEHVKHDAGQGRPAMSRR